MEQKSPSIWKSALTSGLYLGLVVILYNIILYVTGLSFNMSFGYAAYVILIVGIILAQLAYKKLQGNVLTYGQGVGVALIAMISTSVLSAIYTYLIYAVIDPDFYQQFLLFMEETTTTKLMDRGMSEDQIQISLDMQKKFQSPGMLAGSAVIGGVIAGLIIGLITSIFIKKNPVDVVPE